MKVIIKNTIESKEHFIGDTKVDKDIVIPRIGERVKFDDTYPTVVSIIHDYNEGIVIIYVTS